MTLILGVGMAALVVLGLFASGRCSRVVLELAAALLLAGVAGFVWQAASPPKSAADFAGKP